MGTVHTVLNALVSGDEWLKSIGESRFHFTLTNAFTVNSSGSTQESWPVHIELRNDTPWAGILAISGPASSNKFLGKAAV